MREGIRWPGFSQDRHRIEGELRRLLKRGPHGPSHLREAMRYAVLGNGQRLRPLLALRSARLVGGEGPLALRCAAAVEVLHCASLMVDDLPCMDNEQERRGRPTVHCVYGHSTALLASFALVALAARSVVELECTPAQLSSLIRFQIALLQLLDVNGLCEGQELDLHLKGWERENQRGRINQLKTASLFELAAQAGTVTLDPQSWEATQLHRFGREYGHCYQLVDDYLDGEISDVQEIKARLTRLRTGLKPFEPAGGELLELISYLEQRCLSHASQANLHHR